MNKKLLSLMLLGMGAFSSQAAIYLVGDFTVYNSETKEDVTTHREIEMSQFDGDVYCFWLTNDGRVNNIQIKDTDSDEEIVYGAESDGNFKLSSTKTWQLKAGSGNNVKLSDASAGNTLIDFFYDKAKHQLTMVDKKVDIYLRGDYDTWGLHDNLKLKYEGSGIYKLRYTELKSIPKFNEFTIANADWSIKYGVSNTEDDKISFSSAKKLVDDGQNAKLSIGFLPNYFELVFNALTKEFTAQVPLWLRGLNYGSWNVDEKYRFKPSPAADNVYYLDFGKNEKMTGKFKIADENWSQPFNFGDAFGDGNVFRLNYTGGGDIDCDVISAPETQYLYVAFFKENGEVKCNLFIGLPSQLYLIGWGNNWNTASIPNTLQQKADQEWIYENAEELTLDGVNSFRIFDNTYTDKDLELQYRKTSWGHNGDVDGFEPTFSANGQDATVDMIKGWTNNVKLDSSKRKGPFFFTFNIFTGQLKIKNTDTSSVNKVADDAVKVVAANGAISAEGALIDVYTVSGACIARQAEKVNAANGLYIVVANGKAQKVVLK